MAWIFLTIAGVFEISWAIGIKYTQGFIRLWPSVLKIAAMAVSFYFLARSLKTIPVGTGYAVWTGIGVAGTAIIGMILLGESRELSRLLCVALIIAGVVGLKITSESSAYSVRSQRRSHQVVAKRSSLSPILGMLRS